MFISYRVSFDDTLRNGEFAWWQILSADEHDYYESVVRAMVRWCKAQPGLTAQDIVRLAILNGYTQNLTIAAIIWRLHAEVSED